uniref:Phosphatidylinositol specific phospholipase C X domain containing 1 n=1 Tax=Pan troglodytes TaxID=9598 RepID=A0A2I3TBF2_PANTR
MGGQVSASNSFSRLHCRNASEDWMSALCPRLWDVPLHHLSIPGEGGPDTDDDCLNKNPHFRTRKSGCLRLLNRPLPCITWSAHPGNGLILCPQALDVTEQLVKNLHFVHMVYTTALVRGDTLTEISEWLERHPREVVILACRNFEGLSEDLHEYLVACIKNIFGDMLCPRGEVPTLRQLWSRGQQVIVSYEDESSLRRHHELWPGVPYWWGNRVKTEALIRYLETMKSCGRPGGLFVAGINLTENLQYVLAHPSESLEKMTLPNLPRLSAWVREQCPGPGSRCTNIIAGDFIGADGFVSDVIALNQKLLWC